MQTILGAIYLLSPGLCQHLTASLPLVCETPLYPLINSLLLAEVCLNILIQPKTPNNHYS